MIYFNRYTIRESIYFLAEGHWENILKLTFCQLPPSCLASFPQWCLFCCSLPIREYRHLNNCRDRTLWIQHLSHDTIRFDFLTNLTWTLPWTWPNTSKSHCTSKFVSSMPIFFPQVKSKSPEFSHTFLLCHRAIAHSLELQLRWMNEVNLLLKLLPSDFPSRQPKQKSCLALSHTLLLPW